MFWLADLVVDFFAGLIDLVIVRKERKHRRRK